MNVGGTHQNPSHYDYEDEGEYYNGNDHQNYDPNYQEQDDYEQNYDEGQQFYQPQDHYEDYHKNRGQDLPQSRGRDLPRGNKGDNQRFTGQDNSNKGVKKGSTSREYEERIEPGSITETIDANKVKTSKLFQKFLKNENKENPARLGRSKSPMQKEGKDANKNRSHTPKGNKQAFGQNQGQLSPQNQPGFVFENYPQLKERGRRNYDERDEGFEPPLRESSADNRGYEQQNREPNEYEYMQDYRNPDVDLNQQSSSKLVSLQTHGPEMYPSAFPGFQGQPPNGPYLMPNAYPPFMGYGMNPEMMKNAPQQNYQMGNPTEVFMLRAQVMELNQALAREIEANKTLDSRCSEYLSQLEKSAQNFEEFKTKIYDQDSGHQEEVRRLQEKIRGLNETLAEKERTDEQQSTEISKLRRKLDAELESRGKLLEEHDDLERRKFEELDRLRRELDEKTDEVQKLRRENDSSRHTSDGFKAAEERFIREIRGLKTDNTDLTRANEELRKNVEDKNQQINLANMETNSLRNQVDTMDTQYRDLLAENDRVKRDHFYLKEKLLAAESEIKSLQLSLDKSQINADQASEALSRTEKALERERRTTADLKSQLMSDSTRVNQWEGPRKDYSSINRQEDRRYEEYNPRAEDVAPTRNRDQFQPTKYELRREGTKPIQRQDSDEAQYQQRNQEPQNRQRQYQQQYSMPENESNKYGNQVRGGGRNVETEEQPTRSYQQQGSFSRNQDRENVYEERNRANVQRGGYSGDDSGRNAQKNDYNRNQPSTKEGQRTPQDNNNYGPSVAKMTSQNQVFKPTNNLLSWDEPQNEAKPNSRKTREVREEKHEDIPVGPSGGRRQRGVPEPQENFLVWDESPVDNKGVNRRGKEVVERQEENFGGRRRQKTPEEERPQLNSNKKPTQNQAPSSGVTYGKDDKKIPQEDKEVKGFERELMNLQMQRDNLHNELQRLDKAKIKSGANIKRKQEVESELNMINSNISNVKTRLRELGALLPF